MKGITVPQMRAITGETPQEAALLFSETMMELAPLHPTFTREGDTYYIQYSVMVGSAEAEEDEKPELPKGQCKTCKHCVRDLNRFGDIDARKVWATCAKTGERILIREQACMEYERKEV